MSLTRIYTVDNQTAFYPVSSPDTQNCDLMILQAKLNRTQGSQPVSTSLVDYCYLDLITSRPVTVPPHTVQQKM